MPRHSARRCLFPFKGKDLVSSNSKTILPHPTWLNAQPCINLGRQLQLPSTLEIQQLWQLLQGCNSWRHAWSCSSGKTNNFANAFFPLGRNNNNRSCRCANSNNNNSCSSTQQLEALRLGFGRTASEMNSRTAPRYAHCVMSDTACTVLVVWSRYEGLPALPTSCRGQERDADNINVARITELFL